MKFIIPPQVEESSEIVKFGKKLVNKYPDIGSKGNITLYYTGAISTLEDDNNYAIFMFINKTDTPIKTDLEFNINWSYDDTIIYNNVIVEYKVDTSGELPSHSSTLLPLFLTEEQREVVSQIQDEQKMSLIMSDITMKDTRR